MKSRLVGVISSGAGSYMTWKAETEKGGEVSTLHCKHMDVTDLMLASVYTGSSKIVQCTSQALHNLHSEPNTRLIWQEALLSRRVLNPESQTPQNSYCSRKKHDSPPATSHSCRHVAGHHPGCSPSPPLLRSRQPRLQLTHAQVRAVATVDGVAVAAAVEFDADADAVVVETCSNQI